MINYSTYMWKSPLDETAKEQAYAKNQVTKVMSFDDFVKHISDHNGVDVYKRQPPFHLGIYTHHGAS